MSVIQQTVKFGGKILTLETGKVARQANSVMVRTDDGTVVMVNVVAKKEANPSKDFFPLRVDYQEKFYASGQIPGGFFKREGRPSEREILICRLIDRPIRPLFPKNFTNEVQIVATVLSLNPDSDPDILALIGASAAVKLTGAPFNGPMAAARVGYKDGSYILNPTQEELKTSDLNLVVAGTSTSVLMVESEAKMLPEDVMLGAVMYGHEQFQPVIAAINELVAKAGTVAWDWQAPATNADLESKVQADCQDKITQYYLIQDKVERHKQLGLLKDEMTSKYVCAEENNVVTEKDVTNIIAALEKSIVRGNVLTGKPRIDGRDVTSIRPIATEVSFLPRAHGSALFTRGETQSITAITLGSGRDAQMSDGPMGEVKDNFMLHYNFPPYCVGETGMVGAPKRREIGHGKLARRGIQAVLPSVEEFPYVIRSVCEITESNGSSSMASICGTSLALMNAGVPIKAPVAGIAMGLIKDKDNFAVLSDILGDEDHLGDMDFKVAGTSEGITALQMDIKIDGITEEIMQKALCQAKQGRLHILGEMQKSISKSASELSEHAPQIITFKINPEKIGDVIGKGGATIRALTEETGASVDLKDDGTVQIFAENKAAGDEARERIEALTKDLEIGEIIEGKVMRIVDFGAFVNLLPGKDGLLHISQISNERIENVTDVLAEGQMVTVKVLDIDRQGRVKLSMKELAAAPA